MKINNSITGRAFLKTLILAIGVISFSGCAFLSGAGKVSSTYNKSTGIATYGINENFIGITSVSGSPETLDLCPFVIVDQSGAKIYEIRVGYNGTGWLFVDAGYTLSFNLDGEDAVLLASSQGSFSAREVVYGNSVKEGIVYPVEPETIRKIASAGTAKVSLKGNKKSIGREFNGENFAAMRLFVKEAIDGNPSINRK